MIKKIAFLTFISCIALAESYAPPKLEQPQWDKVDTEIQQESYAVEEDSQKGLNVEVESSVENPDSADRKPSSGEDSRPQFWDFKVVK